MLINNRPLINMHTTPQPPPGMASNLQTISKIVIGICAISIVFSVFNVLKNVILNQRNQRSGNRASDISSNFWWISVPVVLAIPSVIVTSLISPGVTSENESSDIPEPSASATVSSTAVPTTSPTPSEHTTSIKINWEPIAWGVVAAVVVAILSVIAWLTWKYVKKTRMQQKPWGRIKEKIGDIKAEYAAAESDPTTIVTRPLLLDVEYQYTKAFHERLADADKCVAYGELDKAEYQLTRLTTAWQRLLSQSKHEGIPRVSAKTKARAQRLLDMVLSTTSTDGERATAWQNLTEILNEAGISEIIQEKALAMRELQAVATLQLEA